MGVNESTLVEVIATEIINFGIRPEFAKAKSVSLRNMGILYPDERAKIPFKEAKALVASSSVQLVDTELHNSIVEGLPDDRLVIKNLDEHSLDVRNESNAAANAGAETPPKRGRGRPRRNVEVAPSVEVAPNVETHEGPGDDNDSLD